MLCICCFLDMTTFLSALRCRSTLLSGQRITPISCSVPLVVGKAELAPGRRFILRSSPTCRHFCNVQADVTREPVTIFFFVCPSDVLNAWKIFLETRVMDSCFYVIWFALLLSTSTWASSSKTWDIGDTLWCHRGVLPAGLLHSGYKSWCWPLCRYNQCRSTKILLAWVCLPLNNHSVHRRYFRHNAGYIHHPNSRRRHSSLLCTSRQNIRGESKWCLTSHNTKSSDFKLWSNLSVMTAFCNRSGMKVKTHSTSLWMHASLGIP